MKKIENLFQQRVRSKLKNQEIHKMFVHNSSQRILTERKSFIPAIKLHNTSQNIPYEKYIMTSMSKNRGPRQEVRAAHTVCYVVGILRVAKHFLKKQHHKRRKISHQFSKKKQTITILPADKGKTTVVTAKKYITKGIHLDWHRHLPHTHTKYHVYVYGTPSGMVHQVYGTPKIHKK